MSLNIIDRSSTYFHSSCWRLALGNQRFAVWVRLLTICRGELSAVIDQLMSKCLWSRWKWLWRINGMLSHFPCSPVIRECLWNKTQIKRIIYKVHLELPTKRGTEEICYTNNGERSIKLLTRKNGLVRAEIIRIIRIQIRSKVKLKTVSKKNEV